MSRGHLPLVCNCFGVADEFVDRNQQRGVTGQLAMTVDDVRQLCLRWEAGRVTVPWLWCDGIGCRKLGRRRPRARG